MPSTVLTVEILRLIKYYHHEPQRIYRVSGIRVYDDKARYPDAQRD